MEKFIPYEKLSKKERRKLDKAKRQTWGDLNPVTRKPENSKAYNRNKTRNWKRDFCEPFPGLGFIHQGDWIFSECCFHLCAFSLGSKKSCYFLRNQNARFKNSCRLMSAKSPDISLGFKKIVDGCPKSVAK